MAGRHPRRILLATVLLVLVAAVALTIARRPAAIPDRPIGLYTSLPILWREAPGVAGLLGADSRPHWARAELARHGRLRSLDTLAGKDGKLPLAEGALLVLAQPPALAPQDNVALDDWVRGGGRVLLFADPMLTADSAFALGDPRRPQDIALLSPILARWGVSLVFDEDQPSGPRAVSLLGGDIPVDLAGRFVLSGPGCRLLAQGLAARCPIGRGTVLAVADAALLEEGTGGDEATRSAMLDTLLREFLP
jgi:hypothetical protein